MVASKVVKVGTAITYIENKGIAFEQICVSVD